MKDLHIVVLGSGTSTGVPNIGCECLTCLSPDPRNQRLRPSILVSDEETTILIDTTPDFRVQMLRSGTTRVDAVLYTHAHFDHIGGFDDLRQLQYISGEPTPVYGTETTMHGLLSMFGYAFTEPKQWGGGIPRAVIHSIRDEERFVVGTLEIQAIPILHGCLPVTGYRIGSFAYLTDVSDIPATSLPLLEHVEHLILSALHHRPHPTHLHLSAAIDWAHRIGARDTGFTHLAHQIHWERDSALLPPNMYFCYDGLSRTVRMSP